MYPRFSARRKLDRYSFVSQCFSWFLCPNLKLDLSVSVSRKYAMQYSPRTWETNTYDADQFIRCRTAHWFHFYRYSKDWSVCLSVGHACQSDSDLRSGMDRLARRQNLRRGLHSQLHTFLSNVCEICAKYTMLQTLHLSVPLPQ